METITKPCFVYLVRLSETNHPKKASTGTNPRQPKPKRRLKCPVCPQTCANQFFLDEHLRVHTGERPFACEVCNKKFKTPSSVRQHSRVHSHERPYACLWCDKCFKTEGVLMNHILTHTKETPFFCGNCPATFSSATGLIQHKTVNHDFGKGRKCEHCNKNFYSPSTLKEHIRVHTGEKPFSCAVCGSSFSLKSGLNVHSRIHSGSKPFSCKKCTMQFRTNGHLSDHIRSIHSNVRPYKCEICGKPFARKYDRDSHTMTHLNEKHHRCQICGKRFATSGALCYHKKAYHDNIRSFKCSKCPSSFVDRYQMKVHYLRRHCSPTERPLHCIFCSKTYCLQGQLDNHLRSHLKEKPYFCNLCHYSAGHKKSLERHLLKTHT